jgi:hypothetical protein
VLQPAATSDSRVPARLPSDFLRVGDVHQYFAPCDRIIQITDAFCPFLRCASTSHHPDHQPPPRDLEFDRYILR